MSTECTAEPAPPECPEWQTLAGEFVEIHRDGDIYRSGRVDDTMPDGSGLWMAAEGALGRELIWREEGFTVGTVYARVAEIDRSRLEGGWKYNSGFSEGPHTPGDRS